MYHGRYVRNKIIYFISNKVPHGNISPLTYLHQRANLSQLKHIVQYGEIKGQPSQIKGITNRAKQNYCNIETTNKVCL